LLYTADGVIIGISDSQYPPEDYLWQEMDRVKFEAQYGLGPYIWLRMQDGDRLILDSEESDGWQERTTD